MRLVTEISFKDIANPIVRRDLQFYPENAGSQLREASQGGQWLNDTDAQYLTPMHRIGHRDFYIFEPALLTNQTVCMPHRWYRQDGEMKCYAWCMCVHVAPDGQKGWQIDTWDSITISESMFELCGVDLQTVHLGSDIPPFKNILGL